MPTINIVAHSSLSPERVLEAAYDFSKRRAEVWPNVSMRHFEVHEQAKESADVSEGTRAGPIVNWERCRYDWSQPGSVKATVTDSNVYAVPGSSWEIKATPADGGSRVEMIWVRAFRSDRRGRFFGRIFRSAAAKPLFGWDARRTLKSLERLEREAS
jgi:hypothetical protein